MKNNIFEWSKYKSLGKGLYENPGQEIDKGPGGKTNGGSEENIENMNFACSFARENRLRFYDSYCKFCPFGDFSKSKRCLDGLYGKWNLHTMTHNMIGPGNIVKELICKYAKEILEKPLRTDIEIKWR